MTVMFCDHCGDITVDPELCRCAAPYDPVEVRRRHHTAVARASTTAAASGRELHRPYTRHAA